MLLSRYFIPIIKENPSEASIVSHRLMLRAGLVRQLSAGIYNWLPLGSLVLKKIENIVRDGMNKSGAIEIIMPYLQPAQLWQESGRYDDYGLEMLRVKDRHERDMLFGPTAEEVVTDIFRQNVKSYKNLPLNLYEIQWKFRDEIRPRFGIMRGREFMMKDSYSFDIDEASSRQTYFLMFSTYLKIFKNMGLTAIPVKADTGPIGGNLSHEFQILAKTGESEIYYDKAFEEIINDNEVDVAKLSSLYAAADDLHIEDKCPIKNEDLRTARGIEVGHIFYFGTKYSKAMNASFVDKNGSTIIPHMGSYGIGVSRLVGAIIESSHDENGIIWPESVAPFKVAIINLRTNDQLCDKIADYIYQSLQNKSVEVIYDDTSESPGKKFANMDLIGIPWQIIIGPNGAKNNIVELKNRRTGERVELSVEACLSRLI